MDGNTCKYFSVSLSLSLSLRSIHHFLGGPGSAGNRMSPFQILLALRVMEVVVTTGAIRCAKLQSNHYLQQTNTQFFTGRMPFLWPNQQWQYTFIHVRSTARHNFSRCTGVVILCILFLRQHILTTCKQIHSSHGSVVNVTDSSRSKPSCNSCWQWWH